MSKDYLFGYGSLVDEKSRRSTWPSAVAAYPAVVRGIRRGWFDRGVAPGPGITFLGAVPGCKKCSANGVIFPVTQEELSAFDARETGYTKMQVPTDNIKLLCDPLGEECESLPARARVWYYVVKDPKPVTPEYPIAQSYVDVCLNGCLELEDRYPLARRARFAYTFIRTTSGWSRWWVNDRIYPRRPFVYVPRATDIDRLVIDTLGEKIFVQIRIEPPSWSSHNLIAPVTTRKGDRD